MPVALPLASPFGAVQLQSIPARIERYAISPKSLLPIHTRRQFHDGCEAVEHGGAVPILDPRQQMPKRQSIVLAGVLKHIR